MLPEIFVPTRNDIINLKVGDMALSSFGKWEVVSKIFASGINSNGKAYVCFYTMSNSGLNCSNSYTEGELVRTVALSYLFTSHELDKIENDINNYKSAKYN